MAETRAEMHGVTRVVADALDDYLFRYHGLATSHTHPDDFLEQLKDAGLRVELAE